MTPAFPCRTAIEIGLLVAVLILSLFMRLTMINNTVVQTADLRGDARLYASYALNLKLHSVYSQDMPSADLATFRTTPPKPDKIVNPGYPLFLMPFLDHPIQKNGIKSIKVTHTILSVATLLIFYMIFRHLLGKILALGATTILSINPHLIAANAFILSETLFLFMVSMLILFYIAMTQYHSRWLAFVVGILLGASILVRPTMTYFVFLLIPFVCLSYRNKKGLTLSLMIVLGLTLSYSPWLVRNMTLESESLQPSLTNATINKGMYPGIMFHNLPFTQGRPDHFDPEFKARNHSIQRILEEIFRRWQENPAEYTQWYLIGKPIMFFSWNVLTGGKDIEIYPLIRSPYSSIPIFQITHQLSYKTHWLIVASSLLGILLMLLPSSAKMMGNNQRQGMGLLAIIVVYFILVHIAGTPMPRYSIPLRPILVGLAALPICLLITQTNRWHLLPKVKSHFSRVFRKISTG